jgi:hypothetical protein
VIRYPVNFHEGERSVWTECEEGLESVREVAYKGPSRTRDVDDAPMMNGGVATKGKRDDSKSH